MRFFFAISVMYLLIFFGFFSDKKNENGDVQNKLITASDAVKESSNIEKDDLNANMAKSHDQSHNPLPSEDDVEKQLSGTSCQITIKRMIEHGYSKSFYVYLPNHASCNIDVAPTQKSVALLTSILEKLKLDKFYKENCPRCTIDIYTDMKTLEYDYKIMNWASLGIDQCSYNKLRHDGKMQALLRKHLVLSFTDFQYGENQEEILIYPCQKKGHCEDSTEIPASIRSVCNYRRDVWN